MILRLGVVCAAALALAGCAGDGLHWPGESSGGYAAQGSGPQGPVIIRAASDGQGLAAEYAWVQENRPLSQIVTRRTERRGGRVFHVTQIVRKNLAGDEFREEIWFDVTGVVGVS